MDLNTDFSGAGVVALVSAVVTGIAAFLPWVTAGVQAGPVEISASGSGIEGLGVLTLLLAILVIGIVLVLGLEAQGAVATGVVGAAIAVVGIWKILNLGGPASPGIGLYLTITGGVGVMVAGIWGYRSRSERSASEATT